MKVIVCDSFDVRELLFVEVAECGFVVFWSRGVWGWRCMGVAVCGNRSVWELPSVAIVGFGSGSVWWSGSVWGSCGLEESQREGDTVWRRSNVAVSLCMKVAVCWC